MPEKITRKHLKKVTVSIDVSDWNVDEWSEDLASAGLVDQAVREIAAQAIEAFFKSGDGVLWARADGLVIEGGDVWDSGLSAEIVIPWDDINVCCSSKEDPRAAIDKWLTSWNEILEEEKKEEEMGEDEE